MVILTNSLPQILKETANVFNISVINIYMHFSDCHFSAAVIPSEPIENTIIDRQKTLVNIWTNSDCPNGAWNLCQTCFIVTLLVDCLDKELIAYQTLCKYFIQVLSFVTLVHITQTATRVGPTITGSSFAAGCLRNLLPGSAPISLQWFKIVLIIQQYL